MGTTPLLAALSTGLFAGAALYIALVEQPARLACGTAIAVTQWRPSHRRATVMQGTLALVGALAALSSWHDGLGAPWLFSGLGMAGIIAFTLLVVRPTDAALVDEALDVDSATAQALLERWGMLHNVRSIVGLAAFTIDLAMLIG